MALAVIDKVLVLLDDAPGVKHLRCNLRKHVCVCVCVCVCVGVDECGWVGECVRIE